MQEYYDSRLAEYDEVYLKPERQDDLELLKINIKNRLNDRDVFELACGTGYWTLVASSTARRILATDNSQNAIDVASTRKYSCPVEFAVANAFDLSRYSASDLTMAAFWLSHVPKQELRQFLLGVRKASRSGGTVLFIDNRFVSGSSTPIHRSDDRQNTYQLRKLRDGTSHEVLKNFPTSDDITDALSGIGQVDDVIETKYYWLAQASIA